MFAGLPSQRRPLWSVLAKPKPLQQTSNQFLLCSDDSQSTPLQLSDKVVRSNSVLSLLQSIASFQYRQRPPTLQHVPSPLQQSVLHYQRLHTPLFHHHSVQILPVVPSHAPRVVTRWEELGFVTSRIFQPPTPRWSTMCLPLSAPSA